MIREQLSLLSEPHIGQCARLATKTGSRTFCQATYVGRGGEVRYDSLVGANLTPEGIEVWTLTRAQVAAAAHAQHARSVSTSVDVAGPPHRVISWEQAGTSFEAMRRFRTVALKREVARILGPILETRFV